ncbi:MAG: hypothetical protein QOH96_3466 [Blastocatellia bacterium]|nr:hypothetical protein [Blastocatellia bacterium]
MTSEPAKIWRATRKRTNREYWPELFKWKGESSSTLAHQLPVAMGIWEPIGAILAYTEPAGYGLGKSGWVAVTVPPGVNPSVELFLGWIEESYRAIAPKKLVTQIYAAKL